MGGIEVQSSDFKSIAGIQQKGKPPVKGDFPQVPCGKDAFQSDPSTQISPIRKRFDELKNEFYQTKDSQGWLGKTWDWMKNNLGCSAKGKAWYNPLKWWGSIFSSDHGSNAIKESIQEMEILANSKNEAEFDKKLDAVKNKIKEYKESQQTAVDVISDLVSGIVSFTAYSVAAAVLTAIGGSGLLVTLGALTIAAGIGGLTKSAIKRSDALSGRREYDSFGYDFATGAFAGLLAPLTSAGGSAVAGFLARKAGLQIVSHTAVKGLTTQIKITGGRFITRFGIGASQLAVEGATAGSLDNTFRHLCKTGEVSGEAFTSGFLGGLFLSPVIGGGIRGAGKLGKGVIATFNSTTKVINAVTNKVKNGYNTVKKSVKLGREDMANKPKIKEDWGPYKPLKEPIEEAFQSPAEALNRLEKNPKLAKSLCEVGEQPDVVKTVISSRFRKVDNTTRKKMIMEKSICAGKMAQILADDPRVPLNDRSLFLSFKSNNATTRPRPEQAQKFVDKVYGKGRYEIIKEKPLGVGTVGEAYLARALDGAPVPKGTLVVVKMLKRGATLAKLKKERAALIQYIKEVIEDPTRQAYYIQNIKNNFRGWARELDFTHELVGAKRLAQGARRYKVAQGIELGYGISKKPQVKRKAISMIYEYIDGVKLEELIDMLKLYRTNPAEYLTKYADQIKKFPWLAKPKEWMSTLPQTYLDAINEKAILGIYSYKSCVSHGDPHAGNIFINMRDDGSKLRLTFIDTGLTVTRSSKQVFSNLSICVSFITGNSKELARAIVESAERLPKGKTKEQLIKIIADRLDKKLFKKGIALTNPQYTNTVINSILEKLGIIDSPTQAIFFKSQMQAILHYLSLSEVAGQNNNMLRQSLLDIAQSQIKAFCIHPKDAARSLLSSVKHFFQNFSQSIRTLTQFLSTPKQ